MRRKHLKKKYCLSGMLIAICIMSLTACNFATSSENMTQNGETDSQNASDELNVEENQTEIKEDNKANDENQEFVLPEEKIVVSNAIVVYDLIKQANIDNSVKVNN